MADGYLTIGAFSRRVGVSIELLRAWERRYGIPSPIRAESLNRLYADTDVQLVAGMRRALARGLPRIEAARVAASKPGLSASSIDGGAELDLIRIRLRDALT